MRYWKVLILFLLFFGLQQICVQPSFQPIGTQNQLAIAQFDDDPVRIMNNTDFVTQGWPGNGTPSNPYLLENLTIFGEDGPSAYSGIYISHTDAFFVIRNCTLKLPIVANGAAIQLYNVTNGRIMNCTMTSSEYDYGSSYDFHGIHISQSSNVRVTESVVIGYSSGIDLSDSTSCFIGYSTFRNQRYIGISILACNDTTVEENIAIGKDTPRTHHGIYVRADCLNCSVVSNVVNNHYSGIRTRGLVEGYIDGNSVTYSSEGILLQRTNLTSVRYNTLTDNQGGILIDADSFQNSIMDNILGDNTMNAEDRGVDNSWSSNWYSDYSGIGVYLISGPARSVDVSPLPQKPHLPLLINTVITLSLIGLIPLGAAIGHHMRLQKRSGKEMDRRPSLLVMVLSVLLPCGISMALPATPLFQDLKYIVVDALFTLGVSRSPGADWTVSYYSSSIVSAHDQVLFVSLPYLVACALAIILLTGYLGRNIGGRLFGLGIFTIIVAVMVIPLVVSVLLVPITPLLALSIAYWANRMKLKDEEIGKTDNVEHSNGSR